MKEKNKNILAIILMAAAIILFVINRTAGAKSTGEWKKSFSGKIVDVDPLANGTNPGLFFEMDGHFLWIYTESWSGDRWPTRGEIGTFYHREVGRDTEYKWEGSMPKNPVKKTSTEQKSIGVDKSVRAWTSVMAGLPPVNKTVMVKYKNGVTITTAYINSKKQWKLETDRERVSGGREITTIAKWRDIQD